MPFVLLTVVGSESEADMVCGMLQANGITCSHEKTDAAAAMGMYTGAQGGATAVLVGEGQLEEARKLLPGSQ
jgi:hypothetical protein